MGRDSWPAACSATDSIDLSAELEAQSFLETRVPELKAGARESFGGHALTRQNRVVGHRAENDLECQCWDWKNCGAAEHARERPREFLVPRRLRCHEVDRPAQGRRL